MIVEYNLYRRIVNYFIEEGNGVRHNVGFRFMSDLEMLFTSDYFEYDMIRKYEKEQRIKRSCIPRILRRKKEKKIRITKENDVRDI